METLIWNDNMLISGAILVLTFVGIFTERMHGFHRAKFALLGAVVMVIFGQIFGFYTPEESLNAIDWNVVFLLGSMMSIVAIVVSTGGFDLLAHKIAAFSKGRLYLLMVLLGSAVTLISLLLDNVTTVVIFGPLIIIIAQALKVSPVPYLLAIALLSDTGGVATLVGDPPNLMIGSAAHIDFSTFFLHMGGIVLACWIGILVLLRVLFRKELSVVPSTPTFESAGLLKHKRTWYISIAIFVLMSVLFFFHSDLGWEPAFVATIGLTILVLLASHVDMDQTFQQVEISLLIFFISLFVVVGGVEHSHFLEFLGQFIHPFVQDNLLVASLALMWGAALVSALIDNIPFTAAMIPIILGMQSQGLEVTPLWWSLAIGAGMGGNGTHLGSTANVFIVTISEKLAKRTKDPSMAITPGLWFKKGTPAMILTLAISSLLMWAFFGFFRS